MDLDDKSVDPKLEARVTRILHDAPTQLASQAIIKRLVQFGARAPSLLEFEKACGMFGRFDKRVLEDVYGVVQEHASEARKVTSSRVFGSASAVEGGGLVYVPQDKRLSEDKPKSSALGLEQRAKALRAAAVESLARRGEVNLTLGDLNPALGEVNPTLGDLNPALGEVNLTLGDLNLALDEVNLTLDELSLFPEDLSLFPEDLNLTLDELSLTPEDLNLTPEDPSLDDQLLTPDTQ
ncbi:hypothetical protein LPJ62_006006 [Coemansia sp. RSA 2167]|nr:hypothetical protein LPJ62_006006 [Coemansia sp. RSA 2167]